jgi:hypothetical protein
VVFRALPFTLDLQDGWGYRGRPGAKATDAVRQIEGELAQILPAPWGSGRERPDVLGALIAHLERSDVIGPTKARALKAALLEVGVSPSEPVGYNQPVSVLRVLKRLDPNALVPEMRTARELLMRLERNATALSADLWADY